VVGRGGVALAAYRPDPEGGRRRVGRRRPPPAEAQVARAIRQAKVHMRTRGEAPAEGGEAVRGLRRPAGRVVTARAVSQRAVGEHRIEPARKRIESCG